MILVVGGGSKIGQALIGELIAKGEAVRVLVRSRESPASLPAAVEPAMGDLADVDSLRAAVDGAERMFLLCGPDEGEVQLNRNAIAAASQAGTQLVVRSSILGADAASEATFVRDHGICDSYLARSGVPYAIVRPNLFMQNITETTVPSITADGSFYANAGQARMSMVDTRDVAAVATRLLTEPGHEGETCDVTGPEALSYNDVATKLSSVVRRMITYVDASDDAIRGALSGYGMGDWLAGGLVELFQDYRRSGTDGYAAKVADTVERLTGRAPRTLDQLLAEQTAAIRAQASAA